MPTLIRRCNDSGPNRDRHSCVEAAKREISEITNKVPPGYPKIGEIDDAKLGADWVIKHLEELKRDAEKSQSKSVHVVAGSKSPTSVKLDLLPGDFE